MYLRNPESQLRNSTQPTYPRRLFETNDMRMVSWCLFAINSLNPHSLSVSNPSYGPLGPLIFCFCSSGDTPRGMQCFATHLVPCVACFCPWGPDGSDLHFVSGVVCRSPWSHCLCSFHTISRATSAECNGYCHVGGPFGMTSWRRGETGETNN